MTMTQTQPPAYRRYLCTVCGFIYDEARGDPDGGLPPGTRYEDIPDDWECPDCGVSKADFRLLPSPSAVAAAGAGAAAAVGCLTDLPQDREQVVILGSGLAGWGVAERLGERQPDAKIVLVSRNSGDAYYKPHLSNAAAGGQSADELVLEPGAERASRLGVRLVAHTRVLTIDRERQRLVTPRGGLPYGRLVLALGASQNQPSLAGDGASEVLQVNDLKDYRRLRSRIDPHGSARVVILGGGLIGCEFADDLSRAGHSVVLVEQAQQPLAHLLPEPAAKRLGDALRAQQVQLQTGLTVQAVQRPPGQMGLEVELDDGTRVQADVVMSALGLRGNTSLAAAAGLHTQDEAIVVDAQLRTSDPAILALGDCAASQGRWLPYVRALQAQVRVAVSVLVHAPEAYHPAPTPVLVKTPSLPIAVLPPTNAGYWKQDTRVGNDTWRHYSQNQFNGFVLLGDATQQCDALLAELGN